MKISVLGCGWLGFPLAKKLIADGHTVNGSTTSEEKIIPIALAGINPFLIAVHEAGIEGGVPSFLHQADVLVINIPPKLRSDVKISYLSKIKHLIEAIVAFKVKKVLFVSSTSVYADDNSTVTEDTIPQPETESGKQLLASEKLLLNNPNFRTTVVRLGGLFGEDRHPVRFLSGRTDISNPQANINLIHLYDSIDILKTIIEKNIWNETFNAVAPFHPTKKEFYTREAIKRGLIMPQFNEIRPSRGKIINSQKLMSVLPYDFKVSL